MTFIAIVEPGTNHLLLRLDAERAIIEIVRRRQRTVIDLTEYGLEYKAPQSAEGSNMDKVRRLTKYDLAALNSLMGLYADIDVSFVQTDEDVNGGYWDAYWEVTVWNKRGDSIPLAVTKSNQSLAEATRAAEKMTESGGSKEWRDVTE